MRKPHGHQAPTERPVGDGLHSLRFDDFDACNAVLRDWDLAAVQLDRGPFRAELAQAEVGTLLVKEAVFGRRLHQTGEPPRGLRTIVIPADATQRIGWRSHPVSGDQLMLFPRGCALDCVSAPGFHVLTISFPEERVSRLARSLEGREYEELLAGRELLTCGADWMDALRRAARNLVVSSSLPSPAVPDSSAAPGHDPALEILEKLIEALTVFEEPRLPPFRARDLAVRRTLDLIEGDEKTPLAIADLCAAAGASRRTLEYAYRERFGLSPKAYMMARRLDGVRREFKRRSGGDSITRTAMDWGFSHMSQFAALYRRRFGELPSETLRSRAGATPPPIGEGETT